MIRSLRVVAELAVAFVVAVVLLVVLLVVFAAGWVADLRPS